MMAPSSQPQWHPRDVEPCSHKCDGPGVSDSADGAVMQEVLHHHWVHASLQSAISLVSFCSIFKMPEKENTRQKQKKHNFSQRAMK